MVLPGGRGEGESTQVGVLCENGSSALTLHGCHDGKEAIQHLFPEINDPLETVDK